jgi:uncharacterized membrane protein
MNGAHLHLVLNHVPVLGTIFGLALLGWGLFRRSDVLQRAALITCVVVALGAVPAYLTGEPAEDIIENIAPTVENAIEAHEEAALVSFIAVGVLGALALAALLLARTRFNPTLAVYSAFATAVVTAALMAWTANLGGRIRHPELASGSRSSAHAHVLR